MHACRSRGMRARAPACARRGALRAERGDTLIEVLVAALLVALVAGAILTGFARVAHLAGDQRHRVAGRRARRSRTRRACAA